jgi:type IV secretory pathway TrbL component
MYLPLDQLINGVGGSGGARAAATAQATGSEQGQAPKETRDVARERRAR